MSCRASTLPSLVPVKGIRGQEGERRGRIHHDQSGPKTCPGVFSKVIHEDMDEEEMLEISKREKGVPK